MTTTARQELRDALEQVVRRFRSMTAQEIRVLSQQLAGGTRTRRSNLLLDSLARGRVLQHLVEAELPDAAALAAVTDGYEDRTPGRSRLSNAAAGDKTLAVQIAHACLRILASSEQFSISEAVERAAGYMCGPQLADWEYVCVNVTLEGAPCVDIGGWQLAAFDYAGDPLLPLTGAPGVAGDLLAPRALHGMHDFGCCAAPSPTTRSRWTTTAPGCSCGLCSRSTLLWRCRSWPVRATWWNRVAMSLTRIWAGLFHQRCPAGATPLPRNGSGRPI
ncbi:hypothetical protein ACH4UY_29315 [Streptomyces longwoodensis]|uniref:hypothetical protein n=1 Tax=Streptomyces longwoodensis TaxID=68231 RepID=UPI0037AF0987